MLPATILPATFLVSAADPVHLPLTGVAGINHAIVVVRDAEYLGDALSRVFRLATIRTVVFSNLKRYSHEDWHILNDEELIDPGLGLPDWVGNIYELPGDLVFVAVCMEDDGHKNIKPRTLASLDWRLNRAHQARVDALQQNVRTLAPLQLPAYAREMLE